MTDQPTTRLALAAPEWSDSLRTQLLRAMPRALRPLAIVLLVGSLATSSEAQPVLSLSGDCPGELTLEVTDATPDSALGIAASTDRGYFVLTSGSCADTPIDLGAPVPIAQLTADGAGEVAITVTAPASSCDRRLQVLDFGSCLTTSADALDTTAYRVLPLGDSITHGGDDGVASYRYPLWFRLVDDGYSVEFVGTRDTVRSGDDGPGGFIPANFIYSDYYTTFDRDHEGYWGFRTDEVLPLVVDGALAGRPDAVLLKLGTNDIGQNGEIGVGRAIDNLAQIIGNLRSVRPAVQILLAQVIPLAPGAYGEGDLFVDDLNLAIADLAAAEDTPASRVVLVDLNTGFDVVTDLLSDGIHPNQDGEDKIADRWAVELESLIDSPPVPPLDPVVSLANGDFESLDLSDGEIEDTPGIVDGWRYRRSDEISAGVFNPTVDSYTGALGNGVPAGGNGHDVAYLFANVSLRSEAALFQTLPTTLTATSRYQLQVAVGRRFDFNPYGSTYGGYRVELLAGNQVIVSEEDAMIPAAGTFADVTLEVDGATVPAELLGQALTVRLSMTEIGFFSATDFDDVRMIDLDAAP